MAYVWKFLSQDLDNKILKQSSSLQVHLAKISLEEIKDMKNMINFCLAHLQIVSKHGYSESTQYQLNFLKKINSLLDSEIYERETKA